MAAQAAFLRAGLAQGAAGIGFEGVAQHFECLGKLWLLDYVGKAHLVAAMVGGCVESRCRSHEDGLSFPLEFAQAPLAEAVGVIYRESRHGVECTHRNGRVAARNAVDAVDEEFASLHIFVVGGKHIFGRGVNRSLGYNLSEQWRAEACLAEFHHVLLQLGVLGDDGTYANATLAVALRHRVD